MENTHSDLPSMPDATRYWSSVKSTDFEIMISGGPARFLHAKVRQFPQESQAHRAFLETAGQAGKLTEPFDRATGQPQEPDMPRRAAFTLGAVAGLMVTERAHGAIVRPDTVFKRFVIPDPEDDVDSFDFQAALGDGIRRFGEYGADQMGDLSAKLITRWESEAVEDERFRQSFKIGLGFVALNAHFYHKFLIEEQLVVTAQEYDWDTHARDLDSDAA